MTFLVSSGKMIFLFPEKMILFFRRKMKDDLSRKQTNKQKKKKERKKINENMIYSWNVPKRSSFQKNCTGIWSFLYPEERWRFFFRKIWYFFLPTEEERWYFSKPTWKYDVFGMLIKVVFLFPTNMKLPFCQKRKMIFSRKIHLKMTILALLKKMIFILEKMILVFSVLLWRTFLNLIYSVEIWLYL